uniref:Uncharacterized protein n=1 Tax=Rhizophora mucronata TaxID=61149 RepID=A0A2P2Q5J7_RHIMU
MLLSEQPKQYGHLLKSDTISTSFHPKLLSNSIFLFQVGSLMDTFTKTACINEAAFGLSPKSLTAFTAQSTPS